MEIFDYTVNPKTHDRFFVIVYFSVILNLIQDPSDLFVDSVSSTE